MDIVITVGELKKRGLWFKSVIQSNMIPYWVDHWTGNTFNGEEITMSEKEWIDLIEKEIE